VNSTFFKNVTDPDECDSKVHMVVLWLVFYISIQVLGWILLPLCQSFVATGEFTILSQIKAAVIENSIWYLVYIVLGGFCLVAWFIYAMVKRFQNPGQALVGLLISLSNAFGLILLTTFSGYGLVELPRWLWRSANYEYMLQYLEHKVTPTRETIDDTSDRLKHILMKLRYYDDEISSGDALRPYVDKIVEKAVFYLDKLKVTKSTDKPNKPPTYQSLVKLHFQVIEAIQTLKKAEYEWTYLRNKYFFIQDIQDSYSSGDQILTSPLFRTREGQFWRFLYRVEYFYRVWLLPMWKRFLCLIFIVFSFVFMWCELISPIGKEIQTPNFDGRMLSLFHLLTIGFAKTHDVVLQFVSLIVIALISSYIYYTLFNLKLLKWMQLIPHHTDAGSLLFLAV
jgi:hypothetical protein